MSGWPKLVTECLEDDELPEGLHSASRRIEVIPADLGRSLYEALDDAIAHNVNATANDSAGWTQEDYDRWDAARARYEREVGTDSLLSEDHEPIKIVKKRGWPTK